MYAHLHPHAQSPMCSCNLHACTPTNACTHTHMLASLRTAPLIPLALVLSRTHMLALMFIHTPVSPPAHSPLPLRLHLCACRSSPPLCILTCRPTSKCKQASTPYAYTTHALSHTSTRLPPWAGTHPHLSSTIDTSGYINR